MAKTAPAEDAGDALVGAVELGRWLGLSSRRVRELAEAGRLPRRGGRYPLRAAVLAHVERLREEAAGRRGSDDAGQPRDLVQERARLAAVQADRAELELSARRGELVDGAQMRAGFIGLVTAARNRLLGVPSKAKARVPHLSVRDIEVLEHLIAEALSGLADGRAT